MTVPRFAFHGQIIWDGLPSASKGKEGKKLKVWSLYIAAYMTQTQDQQHFIILEVAAGRH